MNRPRLRGFVPLLAALVVLPACTSHATEGTSVKPDDVRAQIIAVARSVVTTTGLQPTSPTKLVYSSCHDDNTAPYEAKIVSGFGGASTAAESQTQVDAWIAKLQAAGWGTASSSANSAARFVAKDGYSVMLLPHQEPQTSVGTTFTVTTSQCPLGDDAKNTAEFKTGVDVLSQIA